MKNYQEAPRKTGFFASTAPFKNDDAMISVQNSNE